MLLCATLLCCCAVGILSVSGSLSLHRSMTSSSLAAAAVAPRSCGGECEGVLKSVHYGLTDPIEKRTTSRLLGNARWFSCSGGECGGGGFTFLVNGLTRCCGVSVGECPNISNVRIDEIEVSGRCFMKSISDRNLGLAAPHTLDRHIISDSQLHRRASTFIYARRY